MSKSLNGQFESINDQSTWEVLAFTLGDEEYGVDIQKVQELRGYDAVTKIASSAAHIKGVINLRGVIVPIMDLRIKLGFGMPSYDQFTVVIILNVAGIVAGIVVDSVSDVITLTRDQIKPAPEMGAALNADHVVGIGTVDDRMLILVDIDKLMSNSDIGVLEQIAA